MIARTAGRFFLLAAVFAAAAWAADISGKWTYNVTMGKQSREGSMTFKQDGENLTGALSARQGETEIQEGKVSGDEVNFVVVREIGGNQVKLPYKGKIKGDEIDFTVRMGEREVTFTAKRAK